MGQWLIADLSILDVSFPGLDAARHGHYLALVSLRLGNAIASLGPTRPSLSLNASATAKGRRGPGADLQCADQTG